MKEEQDPLCTSILRLNSFVEVTQFIPIEKFLNEIIMSNVYTGEDSDKNKAFMIKVSQRELISNAYILDNIEKINKLNCSSLLKFISLSIVNDEYYLIFEYCNGIRLYDYIVNVCPKGIKRLILLKQLVDMLSVLHKQKMPLYPLKDDFIFIESLEDVNIKILYANGLIDNKEKGQREEEMVHNKDKDQHSNDDIGNNNQKKLFESKVYFTWVMSFIYTMTKYNMKTDEENFNRFFSEFEDETSTKLKKFFTVIIGNVQAESGIGVNNNKSSNYSFDELIDECNKLCNGLGLINIKEENKPQATIPIQIPLSSIPHPAISLLMPSGTEPFKTMQVKSLEKKTNINQSTSGVLFSTKTANVGPGGNSNSNEVQSQSKLHNNNNHNTRESKGEETGNKKKSKQTNKKANRNESNNQKNNLKEEGKQYTIEGNNTNNGQNNNNNNMMHNNGMNPQNTFQNMDNFKDQCFFYESLIRINTKDEKFKSQFNQIDSLWSNIYNTHKQFVNQVIQQGLISNNNCNLTNSNSNNNNLNQ